MPARKRAAEAGSASTDLGGASRIAPLLAAYPDDLAGLVAAARAQTAVTHPDPLVVDAAEFFARLAFRVLHGAPPQSAMVGTLEEMPGQDEIRAAVDDGLGSRDSDSRPAITDFGQMCDVAAALPATIHLIARYSGDLQAALVENIMAGGDSAARGMLVGMVLGAHHGMDAIPGAWREEMIARDRIATRIATMI